MTKNYKVSIKITVLCENFDINTNIIAHSKLEAELLAKNMVRDSLVIEAIPEEDKKSNILNNLII